MMYKERCVHCGREMERFEGKQIVNFDPKLPAHAQIEIPIIYWWCEQDAFVKVFDREGTLIFRGKAEAE